jgi:disulfide oxidoreductase YuzD
MESKFEVLCNGKMVMRAECVNSGDAMRCAEACRDALKEAFDDCQFSIRWIEGGPDAKA